MVYDWFNRGSVPPETPADPPVDPEVQPDQSSAPQPSATQPADVQASEPEDDSLEWARQAYARLKAQKAEAAEPLRVVADQVGCPTSTFGLADACWRLIERQLGGVMHWSDAGAASWYDFAVAIGEIAEASGHLERAAQVQPIGSADYPTPAQRPAYSLLDCSSSRELLGLMPKHWRQALREVIADVGS